MVNLPYMDPVGIADLVKINIHRYEDHPSVALGKLRTLSSSRAK